MALNFNQFAAEGNRYLNALAVELCYAGDTDKTARILKAVLHVLRDALPKHESFQLMAQLPMFLKAVFVMNWKYREHPVRMGSLDEFLNAVVEEDKKTAFGDFLSPEDVIGDAKIVLRSLRQYVSEGEFKDINSNLKKELKVLLEEEFYY